MRRVPPQVMMKVSSEWGSLVPSNLKPVEVPDLLASIAEHPIPLGWEAHFTADSSVYFINPNEGKSTACLWQLKFPSHGEATTMTIQPLPEGWNMSDQGRKTYYINPNGEKSQSPPAPDLTSTFKALLVRNDHDRPREFFPSNMIEQYEKDRTKQSTAANERMAVRK